MRSACKQGYACVDQVGHFFTPNQGGSNVLKPLYLWGNTLNGSPTNAGVQDLSPALRTLHMLENREFYNQTSSFNGAIGVGSGASSARPSNCTPLTAYYATDSNTLYQCNTPNQWTSYYTPYTYPHPLRGPAAPLIPSTPARPPLRRHVHRRPVRGRHALPPIHAHYHFEDFSVSELWAVDADGRPTGTTPAATGKKNGFCMADTELAWWDRKGNSPQTYPAPRCLDPEPDSPPGVDAFKNGIARGWADEYWWALPDQMIEVSGLEDGTYALVTRVDPATGCTNSKRTTTACAYPSR